jgi:hypothetical protein
MDFKFDLQQTTGLVDLRAHFNPNHAAATISSFIRGG